LVGFLLFIIPGCVFLAGLVASCRLWCWRIIKAPLRRWPGVGDFPGIPPEAIVIIATVFILQLIL
jgi:hypothetical protein